MEYAMINAAAIYIKLKSQLIALLNANKVLFKF